MGRMTAALPAGFLVLCSACGQSLDAATHFAPAQLKKKHPRCRACAPNKFSNQKGTGRASNRETRHAESLRLQERCGTIFELREQVPFELIPAQRDAVGRLIERASTYVADFVYLDLEGVRHVEDAKGFRTPVYRLKKKLMLWVHRIRVEEV